MAWPLGHPLGAHQLPAAGRSMLEGEGWRPQGRDDLIFRETGDEWLLYDPALDQIHILNLAAALVWSCCTGEQDVDEIAAEVAGAFETDGSEEDVQEILDEFQASGLFVD